MFYKLEEKSGGFWLKTYHSSNGDGLENLVYDDSSVEDIWIILSLENKLLAVVRVVIDGDGIGKIVVTDVDEEDTGLWLIVGVVENEENVVLDESEPSVTYDSLDRAAWHVDVSSRRCAPAARQSISVPAMPNLIC